MKTLKSIAGLTLSAAVLIIAPSNTLNALETTPSTPRPVELQLPSLPGVMRFAEINGLLFEKGTLFRLNNGERSPVTSELAQGDGYRIQIDGLVRRNQETLGRLEEGEILFQDGSLMRADGSMTYIHDHYVQQRGQLLLVTGGKAAPVPVGHRLPNGIVIKDHGRMIMPNGYVSVLQDGQVLNPDGRELPAWDTIQFHRGTVSLFKDGSLLTLAPHRMMMMNDGTKVWGNGTISRRTRESNWNEVKTQLPEGAVVRVLRIQGAENQRRAKQGY